MEFIPSDCITYTIQFLSHNNIYNLSLCTKYLYNIIHKHFSNHTQYLSLFDEVKLENWYHVSKLFLTYKTYIDDHYINREIFYGLCSDNNYNLFTKYLYTMNNKELLTSLDISIKNNSIDIIKLLFPHIMNKYNNYYPLELLQIMSNNKIHSCSLRYIIQHLLTIENRNNVKCLILNILLQTTDYTLFNEYSHYLGIDVNAFLVYLPHMSPFVYKFVEHHISNLIEHEGDGIWCTLFSNSVDVNDTILIMEEIRKYKEINWSQCMRGACISGNIPLINICMNNDYRNNFYLHLNELNIHIFKDSLLYIIDNILSLDVKCLLDGSLIYYNIYAMELVIQYINVNHILQIQNSEVLAYVIKHRTDLLPMIQNTDNIMDVLSSGNILHIDAIKAVTNHVYVNNH